LGSGRRYGPLFIKLLRRESKSQSLLQLGGGVRKKEKIAWIHDLPSFLEQNTSFKVPALKLVYSFFMRILISQTLDLLKGDLKDIVKGWDIPTYYLYYNPSHQEREKVLSKSFKKYFNEIEYSIVEGIPAFQQIANLQQEWKIQVKGENRFSVWETTEKYYKLLQKIDFWKELKLLNKTAMRRYSIETLRAKRKLTFAQWLPSSPETALDKSGLHLWLKYQKGQGHSSWVNFENEVLRKLEEVEENEPLNLLSIPEVTKMARDTFLSEEDLSIVLRLINSLLLTGAPFEIRLNV
jgi:hypothetical protein